MSKFQARIQAGQIFAELLAIALPGGSSVREARLLGNRVQRRSIWLWKNGREWPPSWALDAAKAGALLQLARIETAVAKADQIPIRHKGNRATLKQFRQAA